MMSPRKKARGRAAGRTHEPKRTTPSQHGRGLETTEACVEGFPQCIYHHYYYLYYYYVHAPW